MKTAEPGQNHPDAYLRALEWVFLLSPFLLGLYFPWASALMSVTLIVLLLLLLKNRGIRLSRSPIFLAAASLVLFQLLGSLWGCDRGMSVIGAVAFLPLPLFALMIEQYPVDCRTALFRRLPVVACVMVLLALILSFLKTEEGWFLVSGRQAGFFQYPNTYALYLLCALAVLLFGEVPKGGMALWAGILILGIVLTGSRTVFILLFFLLIIYLCAEKTAKKRWVLLILVLLLAFGLVVVVLLTGDRQRFGRFLTISLSSSEMLGRLLYARDAIPVIARHPFGLGYLGYFWLQGSFQSGVYSVRYVHNELLQLLLDVGWIPAGLFFWALLRFFLYSGRDLRRSVPVILICMHSLLDFDMQFVAMAMLLILLVDVEPKASHDLKARWPSALILICSAFFCCWIGLASWKYYMRDYRAAIHIYPGYTAAMADLLSQTSGDERETFADRALNLNKSISVAYDAKTITAYEKGMLDQALLYKERAVELSKYNLTEYTDLFYILRRAYEEALAADDRQAAEAYLTRLEEIPLRLEAVREGTSILGWKIRDLPELNLPEEYMSWLQAQIPA